MRISSRRGTIAFFVVLGICLVGLAVALNVGWILLNWRAVGKLVLGIIFFGVMIAGMILNTIFLVREVRRNEQHDSFINAITHELKTPIASLRLYLQTLQSRPIEEAQRREFYRIMQEDTDRLLGTVEQVLKAGEVRSRHNRRHADVDVAELMSECAGLARTRHHLAPDALCVSAPGNGSRPVILGDVDELRTAFTNLLDNAIKYSAANIRVNVEVAMPDAEHVVIRVQDSGVGIPRSELKQVFKRFYRVKNRAVAHVKGSGLGLFIVRAIARRHGGEAYAESEGEGRGTTVTVTLPRAG
ncbi:MAG: HAMP domain-containing histidine kinase [Acidobacteria bacterium]|nr:HAMP domain-containing histidine kinase [Acidobacteriota bacterium]